MRSLSVRAAYGLGFVPLASRQFDLTQVEAGNVDAGVVYVTDVMAADSKVTGVTIPADVNAVDAVPIATISSKHGSGAKAFVAYVLSPAGQKVLAAAGPRRPNPIPEPPW